MGETTDTNKIYRGDCLDILRQFPDESVDMIYADPPFFTQKKHGEVIWGDQYELSAYDDRWKGGIRHFIRDLKPRLVEMHRVLKPDGSLYLHCDYHADGYIRVAMDEVFQLPPKCEIVWDCGFRGTQRKRNYQRSHQMVYFYTKSRNKYTWNDQYQPYADPSLSRYNKIDENGNRYAVIKRRHSDGSVYYGKTYPNPKGKKLNDVVRIPTLASTSRQRYGNPTPKPEELMAIFIASSTNEGDVFLDPYCGCGPSIVAAQRMNRKWIGIDISPKSCRQVWERVHEIMPRLSLVTDVIGMPATLDDVLALPWDDFQDYACQRIPAGRSLSKKQSDNGIDGFAMHVIIQAKRWKKAVDRTVVDGFETTVRRYWGDKTGEEHPERKAILIAKHFSVGAAEEAARALEYEHLNIRLLTTKELVESDWKSLDEIF